MLWSMREGGLKRYAELIERVGDKNAPETIKKMEKAGLIAVDNDMLEFKEKGEGRARDITRRHRLAERLLYDVFELDMEESEHAACEFEHILSPAVTDSVCSFLGHPPTCPHGKLIPRGDCCSKYSRELKPLVIRLNDLEVGSRGRIVFIVPSETSRLDRLSSLGIVPGSIVRLKQRRPSFVLEVEETTVAIDSSIAEEIYVKKY
ncbi:MAG: metal-dependent transcriptional regulator [Nitrospirae bacterium]|nr:metal-dependent transcriptional regulator [Nitrospirota bacterium]